MKHLILLVSYIVICGTLFATEYTYTPQKTSELKEKLNGNLKAGDIVYLSDGTYTDFQVTFKGEGNLSKPITLKARNEGKVILTGKTNIKIGGSYLVVDGLVLKDGMAADGDIIEFRSSSKEFAYNCRLTNTVIDNCNNPDEKYRASADESERWIMLYGKNNRVDHCYFTNKINGGVLLMVNISDANSLENNHVIDYNLFSNRPKFEPGNNGEIIRIGDSNTSQGSSKSIVENNYFLNCDGEAEIISIKSCDNIFRKNVFYESAGALVCRHGHRNTIESNAFIGNSKNNTGGIRVINQGHRIYNNFFQDLVGTGSYSALCVMMGVFEMPTTSTDIEKEPLNAYHRVKDVEICHNTFVNCQNIDLGTKTTYTYSKTNPYYPSEKVNGTLPPECLIANNIVYYPSSKKAVNLVSNANVADISYSNNIYKLGSNPNIQGFESRDVNYEAPETGYAKGIYTLSGTDKDVLKPYNSSGKIFDYVQSDISGSTRKTPKSLGAQEASNALLPFSVTTPSLIGTALYQSFETDIEYIIVKTDFWELEPNNTAINTNTTGKNYVSINYYNNKTLRISSDLSMSLVSVFNLSGQKVFFKETKSCNIDIDCEDFQSKGIHLFYIETSNGKKFYHKFIV